VVGELENRAKLLLLLTLALSTIARPTNAQPYELQVTLDKKEIQPWDIINITVRVMSQGFPVKGAFVGIEIRDPNAKPIFLSVKMTNESGVVEFAVRASPSWTEGHYEVYVALSGTSVKSVTTFNLIKRLHLVNIFCKTDFGKGIAWARIYIEDTCGNRVADLLTRSDGSCVRFLYPGMYYVRVTYKGMCIYSGHIRIDSKNVTITCELYRLKIIMREKYTGRRLVNFTITLKSLKTGKEISLRTNEEGVAVIEEILKGSYELRCKGIKMVINVTKSMTLILEITPSLTWVLPQLFILLVPFIVYIAKEVALRRRRKLESEKKSK